VCLFIYLPMPGKIGLCPLGPGGGVVSYIGKTNFSSIQCWSGPYLCREKLLLRPLNVIMADETCSNH